MSTKDLNEAKDVKVEKLSDEDLESVAGGAAGDSNVSTACCSVNSTSCCDVDPSLERA